ncbi:hypothetical protein D3C80_1240960 [compost metagenome]
MHILLHRIDQFTGGMAVNRVQLTVEAFEFNLRRQIGPFAVHQHTDWRRWQEAGQLQMLRCLSFYHVDQFDQQGADRQRFVFQQGNRTAAGIAGQDQIQAVADNRVFPTDKLGIFTRQRLLAIERHGAAILRQPREVRYQHMVGWG